MPILHLLAGSNGAGKTSYVRDVLKPATHLPFINADEIAAESWPDAQAEHAYEAARLAEERRRDLIANNVSFISETVFSHPSKIELVADSVGAGYLVHVHAIMVPVDLTVQRVRERMRRGGHEVPENKIRERYERLWGYISAVIPLADTVEVLDNSSARTPFRPVARYEYGVLIGAPIWPKWTPAALREREISP